MGTEASRSNLICVIKNIEPDPKHKGRMIVAVEFDDGQPQGPWIQGFSLLPDRKITLDEFLDDLVDNHSIARPEDPYQELRKLQESSESFVLNLTGKSMKTEHNDGMKGKAE